MSRRVPLWLSCLVLRVANPVYPDSGLCLPVPAVLSHLSLLLFPVTLLQLLAWNTNKITRAAPLFQTKCVRPMEMCCIKRAELSGVSLR